MDNISENTEHPNSQSTCIFQCEQSLSHMSDTQIQIRHDSFQSYLFLALCITFDHVELTILYRKYCNVEKGGIIGKWQKLISNLSPLASWRMCCTPPGNSYDILTPENCRRTCYHSQFLLYITFNGDVQVGQSNWNHHWAFEALKPIWLFHPFL